MKANNLNQVAIWLPMKRDELDVKIYQEYTYSHKGIIRSASYGSPVIRYAKNYYNNDHKFSLCLITLEKDQKKLEEWLDKVADEITYDPTQGTFVLTEVYYNG